MTGKASRRSTVATGAKQWGGPALTVKARCLMRGYGLPRWGNLRRTILFSSTHGFERGQPIDRYYLHKLLAAHRELIAGGVLEVQGTSYTERFGRGLTRADSFDIEPRFDALAYPFGAPRIDYTEETVAIAASLGYTAGFTTRNDFARLDEPALERSRFVVLAAVTAAELAHRIAYAWPR